MTNSPTNSPKRMTKAQHDQFVDLVFRYFDGLLKEESLAELNGLLRTFPDARQLFTSYSQERFVLRDVLLSSREEVDVSSVLAELAAAEERAGGQIVDLTEELKRRKLKKHQKLAAENRWRLGLQKNDSPKAGRHQYVIPKLVAALGVAAVIGLVVWLGLDNTNSMVPDKRVTEETTPQADPVVVLPVATLVDVHNVQWQHSEPGSVSPKRGSRLLAGSYAISAGVLQIAFDKGATVIIEGPAQFEIVDDNSGGITLGQLVAEVPDSAHGFVVTAPSARIVDLGTEFGVRVLGKDQTEIVVFDGEVTATTQGGSGGADVTQHLMQNQSARATPSGLDIQSDGEILAGPRYPRTWDAAIRPIQLSSGVRYIYDVPPSLAEGELVLEEDCAFVPESVAIMIDAELRIDLAVSGGEQIIANEWEAGADTLLSGLKVDSYLLHINRPSTHTDVTRRVGQITFSSPIVALVFDKQTLADTDSIFGLPGVEYASTNSARGMTGEGPQYPDRLEISDDGLTLRFDIAVAQFDELRILVETPAFASEADGSDL